MDTLLQKYSGDMLAPPSWTRERLVVLYCVPTKDRRINFRKHKGELHGLSAYSCICWMMQGGKLTQVDLAEKVLDELQSSGNCKSNRYFGDSLSFLVASVDKDAQEYKSVCRSLAGREITTRTRNFPGTLCSGATTHLARLAGLRQLFVWHQSGCNVSSCTATAALKSRCKVPCSDGHVRTLCKKGRLKEAMDILYAIDKQGLKANLNTYASLLQGCTNMKALTEGKWIHAHVVKSGLKPNIFLLNTLVNMYSKCGSLKDARQIFDKMADRNLFTWTIMITGYAQHGHPKEALKLFWRMECEGVKPDQVTFVSILTACASLAALEQGKQIHAHINRRGFELNVFVGSTLVDMYAKCGSIEDARSVFDKLPERDVVAWTSMIAGYVEHGHAEEALKLFWQMQGEGVKPNKITFVNILKACGGLAVLEQGKRIHVLILKSGCELDAIVGSSLVDMYARCGTIEDARRVFDIMPEQSLISWNAMIEGYCQHGLGTEAFKVFWQMQGKGMKPNKATFVTILKACSSLGALEQGKQIHDHIIRCGFKKDISVNNTLVDMYAKCGNIDHARQVFDAMHKRDVVSWNVMIAGYAQHGQGKEALQLVEQMQQEGIKPDGITFIFILSACSHTGLVDEGRDYFDSMNRDYGIKPKVDHYACMVDLLGRAGFLEEAEDLIKKMPFQPSAVLWRTLLGACRIYGNMELATRAAENIIDLDPTNAATYVLLSNIYVAAGKWDDREILRNVMEDIGVKKIEGLATSR